jgi:hypothetical protein
MKYHVPLLIYMVCNIPVCSGVCHLRRVPDVKEAEFKY